LLLMTNSDQVDPEQIPYLIELLIEQGASNVHVIPALTKKGRPEYIFLIDCSSELLKPLLNILARELSVLGIRIIKEDHNPFKFESGKIKVYLKNLPQGLNVDPDFEIRVKLILGEQGEPLSLASEFEDLKKLANLCLKAGKSISFKRLRQIIETHAWNQLLSGNWESKLELDMAKEN